MPCLASSFSVAPSRRWPTFTEQGSNVFRTCGRDDRQGPFDSDFIANNLAGKRIAVIHDKQTHSKGLAHEVKKQFNTRGTQVDLYDTAIAGEKD